MGTKKNSERRGFVRVWLEHLRPEVNDGKYPIKRTVGEQVKVSVDAFTDGHDVITVMLRHRLVGATDWQETPMHRGWNDDWWGDFAITEERDYEYSAIGWVDSFTTWRNGTEKKYRAAQEIASDLEEGALLISAAASSASGIDATTLRRFSGKVKNATGEEVLELLASTDLASLMARHGERRAACEYPRLHRVAVERERARFSAWYEFFPRSAGPDPTRSATFREAARRLPDIALMGFDVVYLPPIHPIGITKRKGKNNSLQALPGDPGSPWAIGGPAGGHMSIEPALGGLDDFQFFLGEAERYGIEVAIDIAFQCSPDHPYVREHPEWFRHRPDGSIHYAENPPKKYEDIYPFFFECEQWEALWEELYRVVAYWVEQGIKIFRVDNPHTKPLAFWEWLIGKIRATNPDVIFLSEAFTRPKVMYALAKLGFTQSYTYFTWRNLKHELEEYLTELTQTEVHEFFRPNFFANTPDILHEFLQHGGRPAFQIRSVLAATLSSNFGIYSGFELCENRAVPGTEEYLDSEKYQFKSRDWDAPGDIKSLLRTLNRVRREQSSLQYTNNLTFLPVSNEMILAYAKRTGDSRVIVVVNLSPDQPQEGMVTVPLAALGIEEWKAYMVQDVLDGASYEWRGSVNYVRLDPRQRVAHLFVVQQ